MNIPRRLVLVMIEAPVPFGNAAARWYYLLLKGLLARGHSVTAFAACSNCEDIRQALELFPPSACDLRCYEFRPKASGLVNKLKTLRQPYSYMFSEEMRRDVKQRLCEPFDILHLEQLWSSWLGISHREKAVVSIHYLFEIDMQSVPIRSLRSWCERRVMIKTERYLIKNFRYFKTCSGRLSRAVGAINREARISTIPFGLDTSLYSFVSETARDSTRPILLLIGNMSWPPTLSSARRLLDRLWPAIKEKVQGAQLQIVGWDARSKLLQYTDLPDVEICENVVNPLEYFEGATALLYAAEHGSGMKMKVLEAMACGLPVITNSEGGEGLTVCDGVNAMIAEDDQGLIEKTIRVMSDSQLRNRLRLGGRELVEVTSDSDRLLTELEHLYSRMIGDCEKRAPSVNE